MVYMLKDISHQSDRNRRVENGHVQVDGDRTTPVAVISTGSVPVLMSTDVFKPDYVIHTPISKDYSRLCLEGHGGILRYLS